MKIYMAGNFALMKSIEDEAAMKKLIELQGNVYRRLASYYYKDDIQNLFELKETTLAGNPSMVGAK